MEEKCQVYVSGGCIKQCTKQEVPPRCQCGRYCFSGEANPPEGTMCPGCELLSKKTSG